MKNDKLFYKISAVLGVLALAIGISLSGFSPARAQTGSPDSDTGGSFYGMMGNIPDSERFYEEMNGLMEKYGVNCPMHGNRGNVNPQGANSGSQEI